MSPSPARHHVEAFREAIPELLGLNLDDSRTEDLAVALQKRLAATGSDADAYLQRLRGPGARAEVRPLAELLTVCETYFFRNSEQLRALAEVAIPAALQRREGQGVLRVLSAGCSSGEEPYSIAMLLRDSFPELVDRWDVRITGIDVNAGRLERARAGRYGAWSLRQVPDAVSARWFRHAGNDLVLDDHIRRTVRFEERNLVDEDPQLWRPGTYDIVFCRNVLMYFPPEAMRAVVSRIARALVPGGFLFLGHAEHLRGISHDFHLRHSHDCFYYELRAPGDGSDLAPEAPFAPSAALVEAESWVTAIQRSTDRIAHLEAGPGAPTEAGVAAPAATSPRPAGNLRAVIELMQQERIQEAVGALPPEASSDADALLLRAVLLTSCGRLAEAETVCSHLLAQDDLDAGAHYVMALCREHAGDRVGARDHDQKATYLDPAFAMPRLHLGLLAKHDGDVEIARHEFRQAEILLERDDASRILLFGGGFRRDGLLALCRAELRACGATR
jgi:chemotaxis protein methyltransferase CheR